MVIDRDVMKCPANELKDIQALTTVLGGEVVYQRDNSNVTVIWQGVPISFTVAPVLKDGRLYVEAAAMADKLGAAIAYKEGSFELAMTKGDKTLNLTVVKTGSYEMVPIRDVLEGFEYGLIWNGAEQVDLDRINIKKAVLCRISFRNLCFIKFYSWFLAKNANSLRSNSAFLIVPFTKNLTRRI